MRKLFVIPIAMFIVSTSFGIEGGLRSKPTDVAPSTTVRIRFNTDSGPHGCSGTVISKDIVVTAAHCFVGAGSPFLDESRPELFEVSWMNFPYMGSTPKNYKATVTAYRIHAGYKKLALYPYAEHDIAVLKIKPLDDSFQYPHAQVAKVLQTKVNSKVIIAGYGLSFTDFDYAEPLRHIEKSISLVDFKHQIFSVDWSSDGTEALNFGDSGGSVYLKDSSLPTVVGVISTGNGFVAIAKYRDWLKQTASVLGGSF